MAHPARSDHYRVQVQYNARFLLLLRIMISKYYGALRANAHAMHMCLMHVFECNIFVRYSINLFYTRVCQRARTLVRLYSLPQRVACAQARAWGISLKIYLLYAIYAHANKCYTRDYGLKLLTDTRQRSCEHTRETRATRRHCAAHKTTEPRHDFITRLHAV